MIVRAAHQDDIQTMVRIIAHHASRGLMLPRSASALAASLDTYVVADADRAGKALLTLMVDNLDRQVAELKERGIAVGAIETQPGRYRKVEIIDPEGNTISFGQALGPGDD